MESQQTILGAGQIPLFSTARHSSSLLWSGYDILLELEELKRLPKNGMVGIDLKVAGLRCSDWCAEARTLVKPAKVYKERMNVEKGGRRMRLIVVNLFV